MFPYFSLLFIVHLLVVYNIIIYVYYIYILAWSCRYTATQLGGAVVQQSHPRLAVATFFLRYFSSKLSIDDQS